MKHRRFLALASAALCLAFAVSAGWLWQSLSPAKYAASARLVAANASVDNTNGDLPAPVAGAPIDESSVLSPEVLSAAALLIADRNVPLALASPFDSVTDYILGRIRVGRPDRGETDEILITCSTSSADESLQILSAVVDAYLDVTTSTLSAPDDAVTDESIALQTECDQLARAIDQKQQDIAELALRLEAAGPESAAAASTGQAGIDPATLTAELVQARRASTDAQTRLAAAQHDLEQKLPVEFVAARIVNVPLKTRVLERLNLAKIKTDLDQQEALRQKWSAIYGRHHPRMAELDQHIELLKQQIGRFTTDEQNGEPARTTDLSPNSATTSAPVIVLAALETESNNLKTAVQDLETRLAALQHGSHQQHELDVRLSDSRQELEFLRVEHSRLWKQIDSARHNQTDGQATVIEPPGLSSSPIVPQAGLQMAIACVSGMALCLLVIWQFRRLTPAAEKPDDIHEDVHVSRDSTPPARQRFRSHEERQLLRLKLQSAR